MCEDSRNELSLCKLCAKKGRIKCLCVCDETVMKSCIKDSSIETLKVKEASANNICAQSIKAQQIASSNVNALKLCAKEGTIEKLCVNEISVTTLNTCVKYRAAATVASDLSYTLGSNVNWSTVLDDPNSNVALAPFSYTVPESGYYQVSYYINSSSLQTTTTIVGVPIGLLTLTVNNGELRQFMAPYLSFADQQHAMLSAIIIANAGDVIRMKYDVQVMDSVTGLASVAGTILLKGNGLFANGSGFDIHFLSKLNCTFTPGQAGQACTPCDPVVIPCQPLVIGCDPNDNCFEHCDSSSESCEYSRN